MELAPGEPEGLVRRKFVAVRVEHPDSIGEFDPHSFVFDCLVHIQCCTYGRHRECDRFAVRGYDSDDGLLDGKSGIDVSDGEDRAVVVTASQGIVGIDPPDAPVLGEYPCVGVSLFPVSRWSAPRSPLVRRAARSSPLR